MSKQGFISGCQSKGEGLNFKSISQKLHCSFKIHRELLLVKFVGKGMIKLQRAS